MKIDVDRARAYLEKIRREIRNHEDMLNGCREVEQQLVTFLAMVEQYRIEEDVPGAIAAIEQRAMAADHFTGSAPVSAEPQTSVKQALERGGLEALETPRDMTLKRQPDKRQTQIALALTRDFRPGDILTAQDCARKWGERFVHPEGVVQPGHYISAFLIKEARAINGLLERVEPGKYRLREHPEQYLPGELPQ